jgi:hypothetical protein
VLRSKNSGYETVKLIDLPNANVVKKLFEIFSAERLKLRVFASQDLSPSQKENIRIRARELFA